MANSETTAGHIGRTWHVQRLAGYTDGKPSWESTNHQKFWSADAARRAMTEMQQHWPNAELRIRMRPRRKH